jgi:hypothetical protein
LESVAGGVYTSRYQVFSALWWVFILAIVLKNRADRRNGSLLADTAPRRLVRSGIFVTYSFACCVLLLGLTMANAFGLAILSSFQATRLQDEACVVNYAFASPLCLQLFHPQAAVVQQYAPYLQQQHLAIFSGEDAKLRVPPPNPPAHKRLSRFLVHCELWYLGPTAGGH